MLGRAVKTGGAGSNQQGRGRQPLQSWMSILLSNCEGCREGTRAKLNGDRGLLPSLGGYEEEFQRPEVIQLWAKTMAVD